MSDRQSRPQEQGDLFLFWKKFVCITYPSEVERCCVDCDSSCLVKNSSTGATGTGTGIHPLRVAAPE